MMRGGSSKLTPAPIIANETCSTVSALAEQPFANPTHGAVLVKTKSTAKEDGPT